MFGGDGKNHPATPMQMVMQSMFRAVGWYKGTGNGVQPVTSGATAAVASCLAGQVNVADTTAPTITLPNFCTTPIVVTDTGGDAAAHNITVALSGGTLNGTTTITSNYRSLVVRWSAAGVATAQ
jgi:hypothetical protein